MGYQSVITASADGFDVSLELFGHVPGDGAVSAAAFLIIGSLSNLLDDNKSLAQFFAGTNLILLALRHSTALNTSPLRLMVKLMTRAIACGELAYFLFNQWRPTRLRPCGSSACARVGPGTACAAGYDLASPPPVRHQRCRQ